jgi:hypothetical protein
MAKEVYVRLRDDMDGTMSDDVETHHISIDGDDREIELSWVNFQSLLFELKPYLDVARKADRKRKQRRVTKTAATNGQAKASKDALAEERPRLRAKSEVEKLPLPERKAALAWAHTQRGMLQSHRLNNKAALAWVAAGKPS